MTDHDPVTRVLEESGLAGPGDAPLRDLLAAAREEVASLEVPPSPEVARMLAAPPVRRSRLRRRLALAVGAAAVSAGAVSGAAAADVLPESVRDFVTHLPASLHDDSENGDPGSGPTPEPDDLHGDLSPEPSPGVPSPLPPAAPDGPVPPTVPPAAPSTAADVHRGERPTPPGGARRPDDVPSASPPQRGGTTPPSDRGQRPSSVPTPTERPGRERGAEPGDRGEPGRSGASRDGTERTTP